jgi:2-oxo-4-hydroxy-4-carboxy-5-ureidoimidazoline decarboxylase
MLENPTPHPAKKDTIVPSEAGAKKDTVVPSEAGAKKDSVVPSEAGAKKDIVILSEGGAAAAVEGPAVPAPAPSPSNALAHWNSLSPSTAALAILPCCGSHAWADALAARRPFATPQQLFTASDEIWRALPEAAWQEAFLSHPRIGEQHAPAATAQSLAWSSAEQRAAAAPPGDLAKLALAERNRQYEERFGRIFIVCAAGKSATEILAILNRRMANSPAAELLEAAEQQRQITQLRLRRWLGVT